MNVCKTPNVVLILGCLGILECKGLGSSWIAKLKEQGNKLGQWSRFRMT